MSTADSIKLWTLEMCRKAHMGIKEHPWRLSGDAKYVKSYCKLLEDFITATYWLAEKLNHNDLSYKVISGMNHDLHGSIHRLERYNGQPRKQRNDDGSIEDDSTVAHIECCIQVIHRFLNQEPIDTYWTYYTGCNNIPGVRRFHAVKWWQPDKRKPGRFIPVLPLNELKLRLVHYEKQLESCHFYGDLVAAARQQIAAMEAGELNG